MSIKQQWKINPQQIAAVFEEIAACRPLIHMIPNTVSAALCADGLSALGARPLMAVAAQEMTEITAQADASVVNLGQLDLPKIEAARQVLIQMAESGKPLVLDPVGCGASLFRLQAVQEFLALPWKGLVKGNRSEIYSIQQNQLTREGIDAVQKREMSVNIPKGRVYLVTGEPDYILWQNGKAALYHDTENKYNIVGSGCLAGAVAGACSSIVCQQNVTYLSDETEIQTKDAREEKQVKAYVLSALAASLGMAFALEQAAWASGYGMAKGSLLDGLSKLAGEEFRQWLEQRKQSWKVEDFDT